MLHLTIKGRLAPVKREFRLVALGASYCFTAAFGFSAYAGPIADELRGYFDRYSNPYFNPPGSYLVPPASGSEVQYYKRLLEAAENAVQRLEEVNAALQNRVTELETELAALKAEENANAKR